MNMRKRSNSSSICQWYCCNCGQSYGSVIYKSSGGSDLAIYPPDASQVSETEETPTEKHTASSSPSPYTCSLSPSVSNTPPVSSSSPVSNSTLTNEPASCQLVETAPSHLQKIMYYSQIIYSNSGIDSHHPNPSSSSSLSMPPLIHSSSFPPAALSPLEEENSSVQSHLSHLGPCSPESEITEPDDKLQTTASHVLVDPPNRFNCHRCYHMMCPYCPKLRMKDLSF